MSKTDKRKKVLAAAASVFSTRGFHQARMDEIAERAGVAKGTLYYNFSSKSKLFSATVTEGIDEIIAKIRAQIDSDMPFAEHFRQLIQCNVTLYLQYSDLARIVFNEVSSGMDDEILADIQTARARYVDCVADQLKDGQRSGHIKDVNLRLTAVAIVGMLDNLCNHHLRDPSSVGRDELVDLLFDLLSSGLTRESKLPSNFD
ncbi:MAG: TetR/AcrR family transcriptional regulator [Desulfobacterales bacterium]|nr:TetR/AcrR family transcriptional regulator [Desulfobacterales bacterium]